MFKLKNCLLILAFIIGAGCDPASKGALANDERTDGLIAFKINGKLTNVSIDSVFLYDFVGYDYSRVAAAKLERSGSDATFTISGTAPSRGIYFLGTQLGQQPQGMQIVLGEDKEIYVEANAQKMSESATFSKSPTNEAYRAFVKRTQELQTLINQNTQYIQALGGDPVKAAVYQKRADSVFAVQYSFHQQEAKKSGFMAKVAKAFQFLPYTADPNLKNKYPTEAEYLKSQFFASVDFKDPELGYLPIFYEKMTVYIQTLVYNFETPGEELKKLLTGFRSQLAPKSKAEEIFLIGVIVGGEKASQAFPGMEIKLWGCEEYVKQFPDRARNQLLNQIIGQTKAQVESGRKTAIGVVAPEIALSSPDGKEIKLSSLRGKVVLIDFWASWCGPCRRENPNVVKAYGEFKSKGFDIYSVSLDNGKANWEQAIAKDGLIWPSHVSDLAGWQSSAAKAYGVSSIPATFLIDREGKIIGKNLRGEALEAKLREILK